MVENNSYEEYIYQILMKGVKQTFIKCENCALQDSYDDYDKFKDACFAIKYKNIMEHTHKNGYCSIFVPLTEERNNWGRCPDIYDLRDEFEKENREKLKHIIRSAFKLKKEDTLELFTNIINNCLDNDRLRFNIISELKKSINYVEEDE